MTAQISPDISDRIRVARVICILAVIYVHAPPYDMPSTADLFSQDFLIQSIRNLLGRSSVPLLSVISGLLVTLALARKSWPVLLRGKIITLLVPLILWNAIALLASAGATFEMIRDKPGDLVNALFALTREPKLVPLYFLRDMFACFLLAPLLLPLLDRWPRLVLAVLFANGILELDGPLVINSQILFFFALGCAFARPGSGLSLAEVDGHLPRLAPIAALLVLQLVLIPLLPGAILDATEGPAKTHAALSLMLARLGGCLLFWYLTAALLRHGLAPAITRFEPVIFFVFCAHPLIIGVIRRGLTMIAGPGAEQSFGWFLVYPLLVLGVSIPLVAIAARVAPMPLSALLGGRCPTPTQFRKMVFLR